jgi:hypothetical protein
LGVRQHEQLRLFIDNKGLVVAERRHSRLADRTPGCCRQNGIEAGGAFGRKGGRIDTCEVAIAELADNMRDLIDLFAQAGIHKLTLSIEGCGIAFGSCPERREYDKPDRSEPADGNKEQNSPGGDPGLLKRIGAGRKNDLQA